MKEFNFSPRPVVKICGEEFDLDITDVGMISAIIDSFTNLTERYQQLKKTRTEMMDLENEKEILKKMQHIEELNRLIIETAKGFLYRVLGIEGYELIFKSRKPNAVEHIELCNFVYAELLLNRTKHIEEKMKEEEENEED